MRVEKVRDIDIIPCLEERVEDPVVAQQSFIIRFQRLLRSGTDVIRSHRTRPFWGFENAADSERRHSHGGRLPYPRPGLPSGSLLHMLAPPARSSGMAASVSKIDFKNDRFRRNTSMDPFD